MKSDRLVIYASGHRAPDVYRRQYVPVFTEAHTARAWLDKFINGRPYERDGNMIRLEVDFPITLRSEQLDAILSAPISNEEVRADAAQYILRFKYGTWDKIHTRDEPEVEDDSTTVIPRAPKPERAARCDVPPAFVTISALCAGSSVLPTHARAALRASGRSKPDYGWAFDPKEVAEVKKLVGIG